MSAHTYPPLVYHTLHEYDVLEDGYWYIAGPMRGYEDFNFPAFYEAEEILRLRADNLVILNPAHRDVQEHGELLSPTGSLDDVPHFDLRRAMAYDMEFICRFATHMLMLPGWSESKGAAAERALAEALGLVIVGLNHTATREVPPAIYMEGYLDGLIDAHIRGAQ